MLGNRSPKWRRALVANKAACLSYGDGKSQQYKRNDPRACRARLVSMGYEIVRYVKGARLQRNMPAIYVCRKGGAEVWKGVHCDLNGEWHVSDVPRKALIALRSGYLKACERTRQWSAEKAAG